MVVREWIISYHSLNIETGSFDRYICAQPYSGRGVIIFVMVVVVRFVKISREELLHVNNHRHVRRKVFEMFEHFIWSFESV